MKNPQYQCFWTAICVSSQTVSATEMRKVHFCFFCWHYMQAKNHSSGNPIQKSYTSPELYVQTSLRHIWHIFPGTLPTCQLCRLPNKCKFLCPRGREDAGIHPRLLRAKAGSHPGRTSPQFIAGPQNDKQPFVAQTGHCWKGKWSFALTRLNQRKAAAQKLSPVFCCAQQEFCINYYHLVIWGTEGQIF